MRYALYTSFYTKHWNGAPFPGYDLRQRQMLTFSQTEYPKCAVLLVRDLETQRVCRLHDFTKAQLIWPRLA